MVRPAGLLSLMLLLLLLTAAGGWAAAPVIESVAITYTQTTGDDAYYPQERHVLTLYDADGVAEITQVTLQPPFGGPQTYLAGTYGGAADWNIVGPNTVELDVNADSWAGSAGTFTYTVYDTANNTDTITLTGAPAIAETLTLTSPTDTGGVISEVAPTFTWTGAQPEASMVVSVHGLQWDPPVWEYNAGSATSVAYNTDGTATEAQLTPGLGYVLTLETDRQVATRMPRIALRTVQWYQHHVLVYSADPVVESVAVIRAADSEGPLLRRPARIPFTSTSPMATATATSWP